jgi:hypothetical protein
MSLLTTPRIFGHSIVDLALLATALSIGGVLAWYHFAPRHAPAPTAEQAHWQKYWSDREALRQRWKLLKQQYDTGAISEYAYNQENSEIRARMMLPPEGLPLTPQQAELKRHLDRVDTLNQAGDRLKQAYDQYKAGYLTEAQLQDELNRFADVTGSPRSELSLSNAAAREFAEQLRQDLATDAPAAAPASSGDSRTPAN